MQTYDIWVRLNDAGDSIALVHIRKLDKLCRNIVRFGFFCIIAKRPIDLKKAVVGSSR